MPDEAAFVSRGGFSELGPSGKYRNRALYICTHLPRLTLRFLLVVMLAAAQWCPIVVSNVSTFFHVHVIMGLLHLFI